MREETFLLLAEHLLPKDAGASGKPLLAPSGATLPVPAPEGFYWQTLYTITIPKNFINPLAVSFFDTEPFDKPF
jgi:hypothetical protein